MLDELGAGTLPKSAVDLHLVAAHCAMRQGHHADALRELDAAEGAASVASGSPGLLLRIAVWRAELAYFQGRYSEIEDIVVRLVQPLEQIGECGYAAFALRIRIAVLLARTEYAAALALADRGVRLAEASGDDYVLVQILNVLGAVSFDRATSKLDGPHARAHLSALDLRDAAPMEADARDALGFFERARAVAERAHYEFAAWYVAGNIERLEILLGNAARAVPMIRKRLAVLQARGATYDEIVTRSNLAWGMRTLGRYQEALQELDAALALARATGTLNVLLEFLEYDRSIVLDALGDASGARAGYRRYLQLVSAWNRNVPAVPAGTKPATPKRPLEPYFLKRADRYAHEHVGVSFTVADLSKHCGVSPRTLEKAFSESRGITAVAHVRNVRLDHARRALESSDASVTEVALRCGFHSSTTFSLEYRKRFGMAPSRTRRALRTA